MALKVKLVRGMSGHTENHRETLRGLGLTRVGMQRLVPDTKETQGMIAKVAYLLEWSKVKEQFKPFGRRQRRKAKAAAKAGRPAKAGAARQA